MTSGPAIDRNGYIVHYVAFLRADIADAEERQIRKRMNQEQLLRWLALACGGAISLLLSNFAAVSSLVGGAPLKATMVLLVTSTAAACVALGASVAQLNVAETLLRASLSFYSSMISKQEFHLKAGILIPVPLESLEALNKQIDAGVGDAYEATGLVAWAGRFKSTYRWALGVALVAFGAAFLPALIGLVLRG